MAFSNTIAIAAIDLELTERDNADAVVKVMVFMGVEEGEGTDPDKAEAEVEMEMEMVDPGSGGCLREGLERGGMELLEAYYADADDGAGSLLKKLLLERRVLSA